MAKANPEGTNPTEPDSPGGASEVYVKKYVLWQVIDSGHQFTAPIDKYKDVADELGLKNVETDYETRKTGRKLKQGTGFVYLSVGLQTGKNLKLVCAINKISSALTGLVGKNVYNAKIKRAYIPKRRVLI